MLVVASGNGRHTGSRMLDGGANLGIKRIGQGVQERQGCLDVEPFGVDESVQP